MSHADATADAHADHEHPSFVAHHFDSAEQQTDSAKLGMWVFLATEILMFGGLFCAYAVWRAHNFESFAIGHVYLDTPLGSINTILLIASSFTMAWGVRAIQLGDAKLCRLLLILTFLGGLGFMGIKYVEYSAKFSHGMGPGKLYEAHQLAAAGSHGGGSHDGGSSGGHSAAAASGQADHAGGGAADQQQADKGGRQQQKQTIERPGGASVVTRRFFSSQADPLRIELVPESGGEPVWGKDVPPGKQIYLDLERHGDGEPLASLDVVRWSITGTTQTSRPEKLAHAERIGGEAVALKQTAPAAGDASSQSNASAQDGSEVPNVGTTLPEAAQAPDGLRAERDHAKQASHGGGHGYYKHTPAQLLTARSFFTIYFLLTGLHGLHVLIGMGLVAWVAVKVHRGAFSPAYNTPVDMVGLYWHLVDLIWIFLFPLLYLIG